MLTQRYFSTDKTENKSKNSLGFFITNCKKNNSTILQMGKLIAKGIKFLAITTQYI